MEIEKSVYLKVNCDNFTVVKEINEYKPVEYSIYLNKEEGCIVIINDERIDLLIEALQLLRK